MIRYAPRSQVGFMRFLIDVFRNAWQINCCVQAFIAAFFIAILTAVIEYLDEEVWVDFLSDVLPTDKVYTGLTATVGFMVIFYTSQAYGRYMGGIGLIYQIVGDLLDVSSLLMCFSKNSKASESEKVNFQDTLVRLFSIQFSVCLGHLEGRDKEGPRIAHNYEVIDPEGIDELTLSTILDADDKPSAVYQRILDLMMHAFKQGVIDAPPPLYTRCFQELGTAMIKFHEALQFMEVPFPLPYMTITNVLIIIYSFLTPFFISSWSTHIVPAAMVAFIPVFGVWLLLGVAEELDNPFNGDTIDLDADMLIEDFNERLCSLLSHRTLPPPCLSPAAKSMLPDKWRGCLDRTESQNIQTMAQLIGARESVRRASEKGQQGDGDIESGKANETELVQRDLQSPSSSRPDHAPAVAVAGGGGTTGPLDGREDPTRPPSSKGDVAGMPSHPSAGAQKMALPDEGGHQSPGVSVNESSNSETLGAVAQETGHSTRRQENATAAQKGSQRTPPQIQVANKPEFQPIQSKAAMGNV